MENLDFYKELFENYLGVVIETERHKNKIYFIRYKDRKDSEAFKKFCEENEEIQSEDNFEFYKELESKLPRETVENILSIKLKDYDYTTTNIELSNGKKTKGKENYKIKFLDFDSTNSFLPISISSFQVIYNNVQAHEFKK